MYRVWIDGKWVEAKDGEVEDGGLFYELHDGRTGFAGFHEWEEISR